MVKQTITVNGLTTSTSRPMHVDKARARLDLRESEWRRAQAQARPLHPIQGITISREPDCLKIWNGGGEAIVIQNVPVQSRAGMRVTLAPDQIMTVLASLEHYVEHYRDGFGKDAPGAPLEVDRAIKIILQLVEGARV